MQDTLPFQVLVLGAGDAFSSEDYYTSLLLKAGEQLCLVDCPDPIHKILRERSGALGQPVRAEDIDHVVLTHLHGDHSNGLESFLFYRKFVAEVPPPTIHTIPEVAKAIWSQKLAITMGRTTMPQVGIDQTFEAEDFFQIEIVHPGQSFSIGPMSFEIRRTIHALPTFGFRVSLEGEEKPRFGYSCDTVFDPEHIEFLEPSALIFHECGPGGIHTPYNLLRDLQPDLRKRIHLLHLPDDFDRKNCRMEIVESGRVYNPDAI